MKAVFKALLAFTFVFSGALKAQMHDPVRWSTRVEYPSPGEAVLVAEANIDYGWHLYSQFIGNEGPVPTTFAVVAGKNFQIKGGFEEGKPTEEFDKNFDMVLKYFSGKAAFRQKIVLLKNTPQILAATVEFMVCNDEMCLPPVVVDLSFGVKANGVLPKTEDATPKESKEITQAGSDPSPPSTPLLETVPESSSVSKRSTWTIFLGGFSAGLIALIMPCIFPMIPLTVTFFTKQSKSRSEGIRKAVIYGLSINVIYVALGLIITLAFGSSALNAMATDPYFNLFFFALFVVFAISFLGAFEITLPASWINKADDASNKGGLGGVFFMAFTLSLVSFSCTGPLIGSLLVSAATTGELMGPAMGMLGFSLALSIPFVLFAAFPAWLHALPKSGGWLNNVKVVLGFLELAFALKFFSTADMVWQNHWLERELFLAIWTALSFLIAFYLLGAFRMPLDSPNGPIGITRVLFASFFLVVGFYLLPGIFGAPVKFVAGFPPPDSYAEKPGGAFVGNGGERERTTMAGEGENCPLDLPCFNDFDAALAYAIKQDKPLLLDFTGWGCVNCRKMEEEVWTHPDVARRLRENVVLVSLYVDERTPLPEKDQYISKTTGKKIRTVGNKWSDFQAENFKANAQPYYVILGHDHLKPLNGNAAYDKDVEKYTRWLDEGVSAFSSQKK